MGLKGPKCHKIAQNCPTKLVGYEYVGKNVEKVSQHFLKEKKPRFFVVVKQSPHPFLKEKRTLFFGREALLPYQWPMMAITNNFLTNWVEFGHIFL